MTKREYLLIFIWTIVFVLCAWVIASRYNDEQKIQVVTYHETYTCDQTAFDAAREDKSAELGGYTNTLLKHCLKKLEKVGV